MAYNKITKTEVFYVKSTVKSSLFASVYLNFCHQATLWVLIDLRVFYLSAWVYTSIFFCKRTMEQYLIGDMLL